MSSVLRYTAQKKANYITILSDNAFLFQQSDILAACTTGFNQVSPTLLIANDQASLETALISLDDLTGPGVKIPIDQHNVVDLGKTIRIGVGSGLTVDNDIIIFRLVKRTGNIGSLGLPYIDPEISPPCPETGYIVVNNKIGNPGAPGNNALATASFGVGGI